MSDLSAKFEAAVADSENLSRRPANETLLKLYAYYKQATAGDVDGDRPGFTDIKGRAKYDAWGKISGTSADEAMEKYVVLIERLKSN